MDKKILIISFDTSYSLLREGECEKDSFVILYIPNFNSIDRKLIDNGKGVVVFSGSNGKIIANHYGESLKK